MTLAYTAGLCERQGHQVRTVDCIGSGLKFEQFLAEVGDFVPDFVLTNTTTPTIQQDLRFVEDMKDRFPGAIISVFGAHVTALHEEVMRQCAPLDVVIRNEPEFAVLDILSAISDGQIKDPIPGCTTRLGGQIVVAQDRETEANLDRLEFPSWGQLPLNQYVHPVFNRRYLIVNTSRGCKHHCIFCVAPTYYGRKVRRRSPESVVAEIQRDMQEFGINHYWFYADDFTDKPEYVKELCRAIIDADLKIAWWSNTRVDKLDAEMFSLMKQAGVVMLSIGGGSGSLELLKAMKKGAKPSSTKETVSILRRVGIDSVVYFLFGLPGETMATIEQTIKLAKDANPDFVEFYPATPYPGTAFYDYCIQNGHLADLNWERYQYDANVVQNPELPAPVIRQMIKRAYRESYLRPGYLPVLLRRMSRPRDFARLMSFGFGYLRRILG